MTPLSEWMAAPSQAFGVDFRCVSWHIASAPALFRASLGGVSGIRGGFEHIAFVTEPHPLLGARSKTTLRRPTLKRTSGVWESLHPVTRQRETQQCSQVRCNLVRRQLSGAGILHGEERGWGEPNCVLDWRFPPTFEIEEIVIGPCPNPVQSSRSIHELLTKCDVGYRAIKPSELPFRNWWTACRPERKSILRKSSPLSTRLVQRAGEWSNLQR